MMIGTLELRGSGYAYAWYEDDRDAPACSGLSANCDAPPVPAPDILAIRVPFGGCEFVSPALIDDNVLDRISLLVPQSPGDLTAVLHLIRCSQRWFGSCRQVAVFDTAFFAGAACESEFGSPESVYAIAPELSRELNLYRLGYEGILHEAACRHVAEQVRHAAGSLSASRILSICLEPRPEIAAVVDGRPVMVTGGVGRIGGLPGECSCGDIDPTIVLMMADGLGMSVPQIEVELGRNSGLVGLLDQATSIPDLMNSKDETTQLARAVFEYRLRQACGSAAAAMGGIDAVVFSGRYHSLGSQVTEHCLADWIKSPAFYLFDRPVGRAMASMVIHLPE